MAEHDPLDECYAILKNISPLILKNQGIGTMRGILLDPSNQEQQFELGGYKIKADISWSPDQKTAGAIIIKTGPDEFIAAGKGLDIFFSPEDSTSRIGVNAVDEGVFKNGDWIPLRRLNGDETHASTWDGTGLKLPWDKVNLQKITIYRYK
jgi:hypothetical protein